MDNINENTFKEELRNIVAALQKILPKKKDIIILKKEEPAITRLSDVHAEAKNVFPKCFVGAKLKIYKEMTEKFKLVQHYNFGKPKEPYRCYSLIIHKEMQRKKGNDGLVVNLAGSATAAYREKLEDGLEIGVTSKIHDLVSSEFESIVEKTTERSIGSMSMSMKNVDPTTARLVTQFMYKLMPDLSVGAELNFKPSATLEPDLSMSTRYERPSFVLSWTVHPYGMQACVYKQFNNDLRIATIVNQTSRQTTLALAMHKDYQNGSELKIFVDSQLCGGFTFEKDLLFIDTDSNAHVIRFLASTLIDRQKRVQFGFGFNLDF